MVKYNPKSWTGLIFHAYSRHVVLTLSPVLIFMGVFTSAICYFVLDHFNLEISKVQGATSVHSLLGIVLGLFLVFRINSSYDRWWEGRKLWGGMVNSTRNLSLKLNAYLDHNDRESRLWFSMMIPNFVYAMKEHLRKGVLLSEMQEAHPDFINSLKDVDHKPVKISSYLYQRVNDLHKHGHLTGDQLINLDKELKDFVDFLGACERIKATPIPYSYSMYIKKFISIYIITLPFGLITTFAYVTIPAVLLISFVLLSVELIAEEIEDPFGRDNNDLPTDELAEKIKNNVVEILS